MPDFMRYDKPHPLKELEPIRVAAAAARMVLKDAQAKLFACGIHDAHGEDELEHSPIFRVVQTLVEYAQGSPLPAGVSLDRLLIGLSPLYTSARQPDVLPIEVEPAEPEDPIGITVAGALARRSLDSGFPLSCADLAVLVGRNKDWITALAANGELPGAYRDEEISKHRPWRFKVTAELRQMIEDV